MQLVLQIRLALRGVEQAQQPLAVLIVDVDDHVGVLHVVDPGDVLIADALDPVAEAGCGLTVPPADPPAIAGGLRQLARLDAATRERMGAAGRQFVLDNHIYPVLARRFLDACRTA